MSTTCTFLRRYKILDRIGEGSFSEVLKCLDIQTGEYVAAKKLKKRYETWVEASELAELVTMQKIPTHRNLLSMLGVHYDTLLGTVTFIFDLMDMSLFDYMEARKRCIPEFRAKCYLYQMLSGLNHLHDFGVFHRDIKPENILMKIPLDTDKNKIKEHLYEQIKIGDLGSVKPINSSPPYTEYISTRWYRSPECLLTKGYYESKMDIWAVGCVFYEMLTTKPLFAGINELDQLSKIHQVLGAPSKRTLNKFKHHKSCNWDIKPKQMGTGLGPLLSSFSADGQSLMRMMITYDPEFRADVKNLLAHRYFAQIKAITDKLPPKRSNFVFEKNIKNTKNPSLKAVTISNLQKLSSSNIEKIDQKLHGSTENNIIYCNRNLHKEPKLIYTSTINQDIPILRPKYTKPLFQRFPSTLRNMEFNDKEQIDREKFIKQKIVEQTKHYTNKFSSQSFVSNPSNSQKIKSDYRCERKKTIETAKQNFKNYNDIMRQIENKKNVPNKAEHVEDLRDIKRYPYAYDKFTEAQKHDQKKRLNNNYPFLIKDETKLPENYYRKTTSDLSHIIKKTSNLIDSNKQSKSFVISSVVRHHQKRLEPFEEVIQAKRAKLYKSSNVNNDFYYITRFKTK